jgi:hypothetical protein
MTLVDLTSQMYRDPFDLVISSYNYHTQRPQPENWLYRYKSLSPSTENAARYVRDPFYRLQTEGVSPEYLRLTPHSGRGAAKPSTRTLPSSCASRLAI